MKNLFLPFLRQKTVKRKMKPFHLIFFLVIFHFSIKLWQTVRLFFLKGAYFLFFSYPFSSWNGSNFRNYLLTHYTPELSHFSTDTSHIFFLMSSHKINHLGEQFPTEFFMRIWCSFFCFVFSYFPSRCTPHVLKKKRSRFHGKYFFAAFFTLIQFDSVEKL